MKKRKIVLFVVMAVLLLFVGIWRIKFLYFNKNVITPHYIGKIELDHKVEEDTFPPMRQGSKEEMLQFLAQSYKEGELSERNYQKLTKKVNAVSDDYYLMLSYTKPVKYIWYSPRMGSYGWNGRYGKPKDNVIYIYWIHRAYGYPLDGYI